MKILMLSDFYPPYVGGLERHVQLLSEELARRRHEIILCTPGCKRKFEKNEVRAYRFEGFFQRMPLLYKSPERKYHPPFEDWLISQNLKEIVKKEKPDIIHAHGWISYSALLLKKKIDVPLVVTLHDYGLICPNKILMKKTTICDKPLTYNCISCGNETYGLIKSLFTYYSVMLNRKKLKLVDKFIAVSSFVKEVYSRSLGLNNKKIVVIPNFYEVEKESSELTKTGKFPKDFILFVGVLAPFKGVNLLIDAYNKADSETKLVLIGTKDPDYSYKSTENVIIVQNASHEIVMQAYSKCKFVVIPSIWPEACPTVAFEAMSHKKTIVASDIGGLKDVVINNKTGVLVPPKDSKKLAESIIELLSSDKARQMGINGYNRLISHYSPNIVIPQIEETYKELLL